MWKTHAMLPSIGHLKLYLLSNADEELVAEMQPNTDKKMEERFRAAVLRLQRTD